jgi:hypothetical protein
MAFAHDDAYKSILEPAIKDVGFKAHLAKHLVGGSIRDKIILDIFNSRLVLVDLTPQPLEIAIKGEKALAARNIYNWNVAYELGIAQTVRQKEEVIIISQTLEGLPFDIAQWKIHLYDPGKTDESKNIIKKLLEQAHQAVDDSKSYLVPREYGKLDLHAISIIGKLGDRENFFIKEPLKETLPDGTTRDLNEVLTGLAIHKMLELGLLRTGLPQEGGLSYYWTEKGKAVIEYHRKNYRNKSQTG